MLQIANTFKTYKCLIGQSNLIHLYQFPPDSKAIIIVLCHLNEIYMNV